MPTNNNNSLSCRQMARLLKKLCIHNGDIVLVKKSKFDENDIYEAMKKGVEYAKLDTVLLVLVDDFDDLEVLNHQEMNSKGWYHVSQINRLTDRIKK